MNLGNERESKYFEDGTPFGGWVRNQQGRYLLNSLLLQTDVTRGAPGGYHRWLQDTLNNLTPNDLYLMKAHQLGIEDIMRIKALKSGRIHIDPSAYPYKDGVEPR